MKKIFKSKKSAATIIVAVILILLLLINVIYSIVFSFSLFKKDGWKSFEEYSYGEQLENHSDWISENGKKVEIKNADNKDLIAIEIKNEHISNSYIIICHQYGGSPYSMEEYAKHFNDLGFNILLPYMRGHGESPYNSTSLGWQDNVDIVSWIKNITEKEKSAKIALFGVSMGANAVTLTAAEDLPENVRLVISDCCYTSIKDLIKEYIKSETNFSSVITTGIMSALAKDKIGDSLKNADTIAQLEHIELPIMFINGESDIVVPPQVSKKLYENCEAKGVEEVIIENGTHGRNLQADKETYWANIDAFILNNIGI